ncbi:hypothetical protein PVK06_048750 [Gossypium arboreum]|uniref:Uncharacterized protein n=1 Tax=Gossypium arboreum TaxID=29729 RepID=A0ABR0MGQ7_GOSAR|nr:hypothetical protein PVK06_048750 [Gossypium arboreum]
MMGNNNNNHHQVSMQKEEGVMLKKGPWTAAEDAVLAEYVRTHGEGNWNAVQRNTGLARCGKSCRLRWANHLRPNLKKGAFSPEEERIIVELHAIMGNKWARMAARLPGRTDNEIKNYWNTRVKRRQRQGLPLYPPEIQSLYSQTQPVLTPSSTSSFSFQHSTTMLTSSSPSTPPRLLAYDPHSAATPPPVQSPSPASTPPPLPSPSHVSPLQSPHKPSFSSIPLADSFTSNTPSSSLDFYFPRPLPSLQQPLRNKRPRHDENNTNNGGSSFMLPFSSLMKTDPFNPHTVTNNSLNPQHYSNSYCLDQTTFDMASSSRFPQPHFDPGQFISTPRFGYNQLKTELPSNQIFTQVGNSQVRLDPKGNNNYSSHNQIQNSNHHSSSLNISGNGLIEDMLQEVQTLNEKNEIMASQSCLVRSSSSSEGLASGLEAKEESKEQIMNTAKHVDYSNVNPSSMAMAIPEWYINNGETSIGQSSTVTYDNLALEFELHDQIASLLPIDTAPDHHGRSSSSYTWDHSFPGIC